MEQHNHDVKLAQDQARLDFCRRQAYLCIKYRRGIKSIAQHSEYDVQQDWRLDWPFAFLNIAQCKQLMPSKLAWIWAAFLLLTEVTLFKDYMDLGSFMDLLHDFLEISG